jgi:hypothetical protein
MRMILAAIAGTPHHALVRKLPRDAQTEENGSRPVSRLTILPIDFLLIRRETTAR